MEHFHRVFEGIPVEVFYHDFRRKFFEALCAFDGEISTWREFGRFLVDHFDRTGQLESDADRMALFTFIQYFWRSDHDEIMCEIAPEITRLMYMHSIPASWGIKLILRMLKCDNIDDYNGKDTGV